MSIRVLLLNCARGTLSHAFWDLDGLAPLRLPHTFYTGFQVTGQHIG